MEDLINQFKNKCQLWDKRYQQKIIFNKNLDLINNKFNIRFILVGDNPGINEKNESKYLVGSAGKKARKIFSGKLNIDDFDNEVIVLNKTPIFTSKTSILAKVDSESLKETQEYMAELIFNLSQRLSVPVLMVGFGGCRIKNKWHFIESKNKKCTCKFFFSVIRDRFDSNKDQIYFLKHFSYGHFKKDIEKYWSDSALGTIKKISNIYSKNFWQNQT